jgi:NAD(P)-dependent dehydrogenase (short-subunit alcohol dehydrogenase family)
MQPVVLITGGSRGIGAATALLAAQQGFAVAVNYAAHAGAADAVVQQIRVAGGTAIAVQADVADESQVLAMFCAVAWAISGVFPT